LTVVCVDLRMTSKATLITPQLLLVVVVVLLGYYN